MIGKSFHGNILLSVQPNFIAIIHSVACAGAIIIHMYENWFFQ